jgi:hypothetical protein
MKECSLNQWEVADCPKLGLTFEEVVQQVARIEFLLDQWMQEPNLRHEQRVRIADICCLLNDIPPMLGDLGFPYYEVGCEYREYLEEAEKPIELPDEVVKGVYKTVFGRTP